MFQSQVPTEYPGVSYGYGMFIAREPGKNFVWHTGSISGYGALAGRFPERDITVIVLSNTGYVPQPDAMVDLIFGSK
jgi:hypothetical protein